MALQLRVVIVLAAAILSAAVHHRYLNQQLQTAEFVVINRPLRSGQEITKRDVARVRLGGDMRALRSTLLRWNQVESLYGLETHRSYKGGELMSLRDAEDRPDTPYRARPNEFVFSIKVRDMTGFKDAARIDQQIGFLLGHRDKDDGAITYEKCGPFTVRQLGSLSMPVDRDTIDKFPTRTVRLSLPETPGRDVPAQAEKLLNAVSGRNGWYIASFH
ncbi:MAG: hypothetical protein AAGD11_10265 [Planctomycetota bacterium]